MPLRVIILRLLIAVAAALAASDAFAHPIDCTPLYSDSHCVTPIRTSAIPAPTCPNTPGYSTITAAVWAGYKWSQPTCSNYQAPPTCQAGFTQISDPVWNGTSWSAPGCQPPAAPQNPDPNAVVAVAQVNANIWAPYWNSSSDNWASNSEWGLWDTAAILQFTFGDGSTQYWLGGSSARGGMTLQQFYDYITNGGLQYTYYNIKTPGAGVDVKVSPTYGVYLAMMG